MGSLLSAVDSDLIQRALGNGLWIVGGLVVVSALEQLRPARRYANYWRSQFPRDLAAFLVVSLASKLIDPTFRLLDEKLAFLALHPWTGGWPVLVKVPAVILLADFFQYWVHRGMHSHGVVGKILWRTHAWHHAPPALTALGGFRASIAQRFIFGMSYLIAILIFDLREPIGITALIVVNMAHDFFIHGNLDLGLGPLSFISTPRWHRIHHGIDASLQNSNFGLHFTFWDRLFGTYTDESKVPNDFPLGTQESKGRVRLVLGL